MFRVYIGLMVVIYRIFVRTGFRSPVPERGAQELRAAGFTGLWLAGNERMEKNMETTVVGYISNVGTTTRIHSFIHS